MKRICSFITAFSLLLAGFFLSCSQQVTPWAEFTRCATNACVPEAIAVKDAFLKNPKDLLEQFNATYQKGDDHVIGWLYLMRDSVLFNQAFGSTEDRMAMQQALVSAVKPYENDPQLGEMARSVIGEIENLAIASELEDNLSDVRIPVTGSYGFELEGDAGSGELLVRQLSVDSIQFKLTAVGGAPAHNQGMLEGKARLEADNSAVYTTQAFGGTCSVEFRWTEKGVSLKTLNGSDTDCGFGQNVRADGDYLRKNFNDPFANKAEARALANLSGEWRSAGDPKAMIKIADGQYWDLYEGSEPVPALCIFYMKCPADCNPISNTPCLKVIAQDEVCYTIVKADGQTLALSQIGGTGNTIVYKKK